MCTAPPTLAGKLEAAKKYLGRKLITHPKSSYRINPTPILTDWANTVVGVKTTIESKPAPKPINVLDNWKAARFLQK